MGGSCPELAVQCFIPNRHSLQVRDCVFQARGVLLLLYLTLGL